MLRNDVIHAIERDEVATARVALAGLSRDYPQDEHLGALQRLIEALGERNGVVFASHEALREARLALLEQIEPAARQVMDAAHAQIWLRARWHGLAERAAPLAFRASHGEEHAAPLWLRAGQWQAAADAVGRIESWRRIPAPLAWMVHARLHLFGLQASWGLLAELAWLAPQRRRL